jgi:hypothetical protein
MKHDEQFDELARRKLAERDFPFEEAHWLAAREAIDAGGKGTRRKGLWYGGAALLLLVAGLWWWVPRSGAPLADQVGTPSEASQGTHVTEPLAVVPDQASEQAGIRSEVLPAEAPTKPTSDATESAAANTAPTPHAAPALPNAVRNSDTPITPAAARANDHEAAPDRKVVFPPTAPVPDMIGQPIADNTEDSPRTRTQVPDPASLPEATTASVAHAAQADEVEPAATEAGDAPVAGEGTKDGAGVDTPKAQASDVAGMPPMAPTGSTAAAATTAPPAEDGREAAIAQEPTGEEELPLALVPGSAAPQDSTTEAMDPLTLAPLVPRGSPWEVGVLGGVQWNRVRYPGEDIAVRDAVSERLTSPTYGVELMRMGRHFGLGLGLHYSSYDERLISGERTRDLTSLDRFWFLTPVDTTILVITDTVDISGQPYYTGVSTETTINVLTPGTDTVTSTVVDRESRTVINRVSYFEVPLLLDAHVVQGRWSLGVRGGPTLGLLSGRRGSLPNGEQDGYTDLNDQAFRELMIGYQVRTYIRYRFNAGWSVGVEPMLRGQFGNGLEGGDLSRRSSAMGGMLSLTYRLR